MLMSSASAQSQPLLQLADRLGRARERVLDFLFPPSSDRWLAILRVGLGLQVVLYCLSTRRDWSRLFARNGVGWVSRDVVEAILTAQAPLAPRVGWLLNIGDALGLREETVLTTVWLCLLSAACCLLVGLFCRPSAVAAWFLHLCAVGSGGVLTYGMDDFTTIGLFYLLIAPFPDRWSLDWKLWRSPIKDRHLHGFFRRVLQLHLCVIYFFSGLTKCLGAGWWTGESMWRALTCPPFNVLPVNVVISWQFILPFAGIAACLLETAYPFFIWSQKTRLIWLIGIICMHIGIGITMGLYLFALIMIILNLAAFGSGAIGSPKGSSAKTNNSEPVPSPPNDTRRSG